MGSYAATPDTQLSPGELAILDKGVGFPQEALPQLIAVQLNQSSGRTGVVGWNYQGRTVADTTGLSRPPAGTTWTSYDTGLAQIDSASSPGGASVFQPTWLRDMENPVANTVQALRMYQARGWQPWQGDPSFGPQHTNLLQGQQAAATVAHTSAAELRKQYNFAQAAAAGAGAGAPGSGTSNAGNLFGATLANQGSIAANEAGGLLTGWVGQLWKLIASDTIRLLEIIGGGLLMAIGIVTLVRAMSAPDSETSGRGLTSGLKFAAAGLAA